MEKYFLQNDFTGYLLQIFKKDYVGDSTRIYGTTRLDKSKADNILDPIRGTALSVSLQATDAQDFDEFSLGKEHDYTAKLSKNGQVVFNGFLKPDGIVQSFVADTWFVNVDFIDGLGILKDLAFVNTAGVNFEGKMSIYSIIEACLARTKLTMSINTFLPIQYEGFTGVNILKSTYLNVNRFYKSDSNVSGGGTNMDCNEVLKSILNIFSGVITQQNGKWFIYRALDLKNVTTFLNNVIDVIFTENLYNKIGSNIDGYYPHHAGGNQSIQTFGAISAYRLNYKYLFRENGLANPTFKHDNALMFQSWTKNPALNPNIIQLVPERVGLKLRTQSNNSDNNIFAIQSDAYNLLTGAQIDIIVNVTNNEFGSNGESIFSVFKSDGTWLNGNGDWVNSFQTIKNVIQTNSTTEITVKAQPVSTNCYVIVFIYPTKYYNIFGGYFISTYNNVSIVNNYNYYNRVGEFHTVTRTDPPSSIVKENQEVINGDSEGAIFQGAIFKEDKVTVTDFWTRIGAGEKKRILQISAEDDLRVQQSPCKVFSGDIYGEVPYMSIVEINNINGKFMFIDYSYDHDKNITSGKLMQFFSDELTDIQYLLSYDYGNTVKPVIK